MVYSYLTNKEYDLPDVYNPINWIPDLPDTLAIAGSAVAFTLLRVYLQKVFGQYAEAKKITEKYKFGESNWKIVFYSIAFFWGMRVLYINELMPETANCWRNWPTLPDFETKAYYLFELGFYFHSLYAHFVYEVKRSDFVPLLVHHIVTIWLILFSYLSRFYFIGVCVLVNHDVNDLIFETGKSFVYRGKGYKIHTNVLFAGLLVSWVISRLYIFPFYVVWSAMWESQQFVPIDVFPYWWGFNGSLSILVFLHIYWFGLMLRLLYRVINGKDKELEDPREDKEKSE